MSDISPDNNPGKKFVFYHLPVILYAGIIIAISSIPNLKTPKIINVHFDKVIHFLEYALLAFLVFRSVLNLGNWVTRNKAFVISAIFLAVFAHFDELYQDTVMGRDASFGDLAFDLVGAALVLILLWYRGKSRKLGHFEAKQ